MGRLNRNKSKPLPASAARPMLAAKESVSPISMDSEVRRQWLAYGLKYDIQTGLLNTQSFQEAVEGMLRQDAEGREGLALVWIDLVNLRKEFTLWGWSGADALLRHVAGVLRSSLEEDALVSRFSRCFVVALRGSKADGAGRKRIQELLERIAQPVAGFDMVPEVVAGVAYYPGDADSGDDLARFASLAATIAGENRLRNVLPFQPSMNNRLMRDHEVEVEIDKALDQDLLRMVYQPKIDLVTGEVLGAEALIRWQHPKWGDVPPTDFIPIAERSELIHRIFDFGLRKALEAVQRWQALSVAPPIISVNVSPANLHREDFPRRVRNILSEFPAGATQLELEVTESLLLDDEKLFTSRLRQLKTLGVRVAIDDFGTRYTGFEMLGRLPLDAMKIDRCFIRGIHRSHDLRALCNTIVAMGRHLKMRTVAEGIEEQEELEVLQDMGCEAGQGFLFQAPVIAEGFENFQRGWMERSQALGFGSGAEMLEVDPLYGIP